MYIHSEDLKKKSQRDIDIFNKIAILAFTMVS